VEFITHALRTDVERLNTSVRALTDRLHQASDRMEERIEEFNALMEVVQGEAEDIFLDTAATVRGVREGAREGARRIRRRPESREGLGEDSAYLEEGDDDRELSPGRVEPEGSPPTS
jgi:phage shock protein A